MTSRVSYGSLRFQAVVWCCRYYYSQTQCRWLMSVCKDGKVGHCSKANRNHVYTLTRRCGRWWVGVRCRWWVSITICITIWCSGLPSHCLWSVWGTIRAGGVWRVALRSMKIVYGKVMAVNCTYNNTVYLHLHRTYACTWTLYCFACTHTAILLCCRIKVIVTVAIWTYKAMDVLGFEQWNSNCFVTILWLSIMILQSYLSHSSHSRWRKYLDLTHLSSDVCRSGFPVLSCLEGCHPECLHWFEKPSTADSTSKNTHTLDPAA